MKWMLLPLLLCACSERDIENHLQKQKPLPEYMRETGRTFRPSAPIGSLQQVDINRYLSIFGAGKHKQRAVVRPVNE